MGKVIVLILSALAHVNAENMLADMLGERASMKVGHLDADLDDVTLGKGAQPASIPKPKAAGGRPAIRKAPAPKAKAPAKAPVNLKGPKRTPPYKPGNLPKDPNEKFVDEKFVWGGSGLRKSDPSQWR